MINITTGGAVTMTLDERAAAATRFQPELCSMNMGSMNFGIFPIAGAVSQWKNDWEEPYLESSKGWIFKNTFTDVEELVPRLAAEGTRFEFECYDIGHLYNLAHFLDRGIVEPPLFVQSVMGILGGIGTHPEDLLHMKRTADRLFGDDYRWSVLGAGRHQVPLTTNAAMLGAAGVRVGLEDSIYLRRGVLAESNAPAGRAHGADPRRALAGAGDAGRSARDPGAEGRRPDRDRGVGVSGAERPQVPADALEEYIAKYSNWGRWGAERRARHHQPDHPRRSSATRPARWSSARSSGSACPSTSTVPRPATSAATTACATRP